MNGEDGDKNVSTSNLNVNAKLKEAALEYFNLGFNVVLVNGKQPLHKWAKWKVQRQTPNDFERLPWERADGFGVICGVPNIEGYHFAAVDYDVKNVDEKAKAKGEKAFKLMEISRLEESPSGGKHWLYLSKTKPESVSKYHNMAALELLGEGKYVIVYPSKGYKRLNDNQLTMVDDVEAMFHEALKAVGVATETPSPSRFWFEREDYAGKPYVGEHPPCIKELFKGVEEGMRNEAAIRLASYLLNFRKENLEKAIKSLKSWNQRNKPPLPEKELQNVLKSAQKHGYVYGCSDNLLSKHCVGKVECPIGRVKAEPLEIIKRLQAESGKVKLHPLIDYNEEAGLTIGLYSQGLHQTLIFMKEKLFTLQNESFKINGEFAQNISVLRPKWCKLHPIHYAEILRLAREYHEKGKIEFPAKKEVFNEVVGGLKHYWWHSDERVYTLISCWDIATYYHPIFTHFPSLNLQGERESGKTTLLALLSKTCWNPTDLMTALREAPLFRTIEDSRPTYLVDITRLNPKNINCTDVIDVFEVGTEKGGAVPRVNKDTGEPVWYKVYGPKAIAARYELPFTVKCIRIITEKAQSREYSHRRHTLESDERWPRIVNMLLKAAIKYWPEVVKAYHQLKPTEKLAGRAFNYWAPILAICKVFAPRRFKGLLQLAEEYCQREERIDWLARVEDTVLAVYMSSPEKIVTKSLKDITADVSEYVGDKVDWQTVHSALNNLGIIRKRFRTGEGTKYELDIERVKEKAKQRGISAAEKESSSPSNQPQPSGTVQGKREVQGVTLSPEEVKQIVRLDTPCVDKCFLCGKKASLYWKVETFKGEWGLLCVECAGKLLDELKDSLNEESEG